MWQWMAVGLALVVGATLWLEVERLHMLRAEPAPVIKTIGKIQAWNRVHLWRDARLAARQTAKRR